MSDAAVAADASPVSVARPAFRDQVRTLVPGQALAAYATSRAVVAFAELLASHLPRISGTVAGTDVPVATTAPGSSMAQRWDGFWFTYIARHGYPRGLFTPGLAGVHGRYSEWAFLPGYPLLVRGVHDITYLSYGVAAITINLVLGLLVAVAAWHLFAEVADPRTADRASWLFWFFPGSVVASLAYSEPLFLLAAAVCLLALLRGRWEIAGIAALVGGATRATGVALVVACAVAVVPALRRRQWRALTAVALAPLGLVGFFLYGWQRTGDPLIWRDAEGLWHQGFDVSAGLRQEVVHSFTGTAATADAETFVLLGLVFLAGVGIAVLRGQRLPAPLAAYVIVTLFLSLGDSRVGARPRFVWAMLPLFVIVARAVPPRWRAAPLTTIATLLPLAAITYLTTGHGAP